MTLVKSIFACNSVWRPLAKTIGAHSTFLAPGEDLPRHLEVPQLIGAGDQVFAGMCAFDHRAKAVAEREERIQGDHALIVEHRADPAGKLKPYLLAFCASSARGLRAVRPVRSASRPACLRRRLIVLQEKLRAESKSWVEEKTLKKGSITFRSEASNCAFGISPWRASTCHRPMLAWKAPNAFARRERLTTRSIPSDAFTNSAMDASVRSGNSVKTRYQLLS